MRNSKGWCCEAAPNVWLLKSFSQDLTLIQTLSQCLQREQTESSLFLFASGHCWADIPVRGQGMGRDQAGKNNRTGISQSAEPHVIAPCPMIMLIFTDILLHLSTDSHIFKGLFPHWLHSMEHFGAASLDFTCELKNNRKERYFYF